MSPFVIAYTVNRMKKKSYIYLIIMIIWAVLVLITPTTGLTANVETVSPDFFSADLDVYSGNSGSPVFSKDTDEMIGIVVRGDNQDFRWTGNGWLSVIYPNTVIHSPKPQCTMVSEFSAYCK